MSAYDIAAFLVTAGVFAFVRGFVVGFVREWRAQSTGGRRDGQ